MEKGIIIENCREESEDSNSGWKWLAIRTFHRFFIFNLYPFRLDWSKSLSATSNSRHSREGSWNFYRQSLSTVRSRRIRLVPEQDFSILTGSLCDRRRVNLLRMLDPSNSDRWTRTYWCEGFPTIYGLTNRIWKFRRSPPPRNNPENLFGFKRNEKIKGGPPHSPQSDTILSPCGGGGRKGKLRGLEKFHAGALRLCVWSQWNENRG